MTFSINPYKLTLSHTYTHMHIHTFRADTGFRHVKPTEYTPRLLHFHGLKKKIAVKEVFLSRKSLDTTDVFILDLGLTIYQVCTVKRMWLLSNGLANLLILSYYSIILCYIHGGSVVNYS